MEFGASDVARIVRNLHTISGCEHHEALAIALLSGHESFAEIEDDFADDHPKHGVRFEQSSSAGVRYFCPFFFSLNKP